MPNRLKPSPESLRIRQLEEDARAAQAEFCSHCGERIGRESAAEFFQKVFVVGKTVVVAQTYCAVCLLLDADREFVGQDPPREEMI